MQDLLIKAPALVDGICQVLGAVTILATLLARLIPSKADPIKNMDSKIWKFIGFMPTVGFNSNTVALKAAYEDSLRKLEEVKK